MAKPSAASKDSASKEQKATQKSSSDSLGWDGYLLLFLLLGVGGAFGYNQWLSKQQAPQQQQMPTNTVPECGCARTWDPICVEFIEEVDESAVPAKNKKRKKKGKKNKYKEVGGSKTHYLPFPNSCEAECHGHGVWTKGKCKDSTELSNDILKCVYQNQCPFPESPEGKEPVCFHGISYPNSCFAKCQIPLEFPDVEFTSSSLVDGMCRDPCKKNDCNRNTEVCNVRPGPLENGFKGYACMGRFCECLPLWDPHCNEKMGITYTNECFAKCEGVKNPTKGKCAKQNPFVKRSIPMPEENAETAEQIEALKNELGLDKESLARMEDLFLPEDGDADDDDNLEGYME